MKTLLIIWMCLCTGLCMAQNSENDDTHVTINAGKKPLKDILDKMPNVLYLSIRGTLLPEDYIFLKENCWDEIDLSEADIDVLPSKAFQGYMRGNTETGKIILPRKLKYVEDKAFDTQNFVHIILTGPFPDHTVLAFENKCNNRLAVSSDNLYCKEDDHFRVSVDNGLCITETDLNSVYSLDGRVFYYSYLAWMNWLETELTVKPETRVIAGGAFDGVIGCNKYILPESLDSIGHNAFYGDGMDCFTIVCQAITPPKWEKDQLIESAAFHDCGSLIVPKGSENLYRKAPIWNRAAKINGKGYEILPSIKETQKDKITVINQKNSYLIISPIPIIEVYVYDIDGRCLHAEKANSKRLKINKASSWNTYSVIRIELSNGEMKIIKLKS